MGMVLETPAVWWLLIWSRAIQGELGGTAGAAHQTPSPFSSRNSSNHPACFHSKVAQQIKQIFLPNTFFFSVSVSPPALCIKTLRAAEGPAAGRQPQLCRDPGLYKVWHDISVVHTALPGSRRGEAGAPKKPGILYNINLHNYLLHNAGEKALHSTAVVSMAFC